MACGPVLYSPNYQSIPNINHKGDVSLEAAYAASENLEGFGASAAVAVGNKDGIGMALTRLSYSDEISQNRNTYIEIFYDRFGHLSNNKVRGMIMPGLGFGSLRWNEDGDGSLESGFVKLFVRPTIGFRSDFFEAYGTAQLGLVNYTKTSLSTDDQWLREDVGRFYEKNSKIAFEPSITLRGGGKHVKAMTQGAWTTLGLKNDLFLTDEFTFTIGIQLSIIPTSGR
jgi:hypothetical protein